MLVTNGLRPTREKERERKKKKYTTMALVFHVGYPRKKRERRETIAVSRCRAHTEDHPPHRHCRKRTRRQMPMGPKFVPLHVGQYHRHAKDGDEDVQETVATSTI